MEEDEIFWLKSLRGKNSFSLADGRSSPRSDFLSITSSIFSNLHFQGVESSFPLNMLAYGLDSESFLPIHLVATPQPHGSYSGAADCVLWLPAQKRRRRCRGKIKSLILAAL